MSKYGFRIAKFTLLIGVVSVLQMREFGVLHGLEAIANDSSRELDTLIYAYPQELKQARELYRFYRWPELGELSKDSIDQRITVVLNDCNQMNDSTFKGTAVYTSKILHPRFFRSTYRLCYLTYPNMMLGGGPPCTAIVVADSNDRRIVVLDSIYCGKVSGVSYEDSVGHPIPHDIGTAVAFLSTDFCGKVSSDADALEASIEAVELSALEIPFVVLESADDMFEFSNAVASDIFWDQITLEEKDTVLTLLTSLSLRNIRRSQYFVGNYESVKYPREQFAKYQPIVRSPSIEHGDDGLYHVELFTWSPLGGALIKWQITMGSEHYFVMTQEVIKYMLGYYFIWM